MRVGAVVLHYRNRDDLARTVGALDAQTSPPSRVVIVDNASGDGSAEWLRENFPRHTVLALDRNEGYAAGMNAGIGLLPDADAVLLLTHETLLAPDALAALTARLDAEPAVAAVGPLVGMLDNPDLVWSAGGTLDRRTWETRHLGMREPMADHAGAPYAVEWLDGCALLLRASAVRDAGPLDEGYFLYFEEVDYLFALGRRGMRVECVPAARAWQRPGVPERALWQRNRLRFVARNGRRSALLRVLAVDLKETVRCRDGARWRGITAFLAGRRP